MLNASNWTARLNEVTTRTGVPGAALGIWSDGQQILAAHGVLNTATQVPVSTDSVFQVGSITKIWTATMIMQLIDEGQLSLDATVAEVLPGTRIGARDVAGQVTVRHLLTHTSGIDGDIFTDTGRGDECVERYVGLLAAAPSVFTPGTAYSYCNSGYVVLGRIIEVLDGQSWDESLRERLTRPLSVTRTVTLPEEAILHRAAVGQSAYLRIDSEARVAACLLTNSAESETLYQELFGEVFGELTGATIPAPPRPAVGALGTLGPAVDVDLEQYAGRYERMSRRLDVSVRHGQLRIVLTMTGNLAALTGAEPEELTMYPAGSSGTWFVLRSRDDEPWVPLSFGRLGDGTPYIYLSGRVTPRVR